MLALAIAGCTAGESPLQRDLRELAELPRKMDRLARRDQAPLPDASVAVTSPAGEAAVGETATVAAPPPAARDTEAVLTKTAPPPPAQATVPPAKPAPTVPAFLERLRQLAEAKPAAPAEPAAPPGAYDQIPDPIPVENPLARPPWEVFMEAGPNAHNELDLETLYGPGQIPPELMAQEAGQPEGQQAALEPPPDTASEAPPADAAGTKAKKSPRKTVKPGAVTIKAVAVPNVKGAPGSGNGELTEAMRTALIQAGWPVLESRRNDALTVQGRVKIGAVHGASQSVQIVWDVLTPDGKRLGNLKQDNAIPAGSLDTSWGENAQYAAEAAAEGIFKLIQKYR